MPTLKYLDPITGTYKAVSGSPGPSPTAPPPSGVWGTGQLALAGTNADFGSLIYVDNAGKLRGQPQTLSTSVYPKAAADLPGTYPMGMTIVQMTGVQSAAGGWPEGASGSVVTFRRSGETDENAVASQWFHVTTSTRARSYYRSGSGTGAANAWSPWVGANGDTPGKPFAQAAGVGVMPAVGANTGVSLAITFPVGRFTVAPIVTVGADSSGFGFGMAAGATITGCTLRYYNPTASVPSGVKVPWLATQMTSTTAEG